MKKLMMICGLLFGMVAFAQAQQPGPKKAGAGKMMMNPENRVKQLDEKLKLSDEQKAKLTTVFTEQAEAQKQMRAELKDGDKDTMREKMKAFRAENEKKINDILSTEQQKAYKAHLEEQRAEMQKRMQDRQKKEDKL